MKRLCVSLAISLATNASGQYVGVSTNLLSPAVGVVSASVEASLAPRFALELTAGTVAFSGDDSFWAEEEISGYRLTVAAKYYPGGVAQLNRGWFVGAYARQVDLRCRDVDRDIIGLRFNGLPYESHRTVAGLQFGYEYVDASGLTVSAAGGIGARLALRYYVLDEGGRRASPPITDEAFEGRDGGAHAYGRFAVGYRLYGRSVRDLRVAVAELERAEAAQRREALQKATATWDAPEAEREDLRPVDLRRLRHKRRYRARRAARGAKLFLRGLAERAHDGIR